MPSITKQIEDKYKKHAVVDVRPGDTVKVHQKIKEGAKERVQIFEGLVIRVSQTLRISSTIVVRRVAGGLGVEKSYLLHSPLVVKIEVTKRSKVRRNYLTYMRARTGKAARLTGVAFDSAINDLPEVPKVEAPVEESAETEEKAPEA